jgi:hypothetical protein
MNCVASAEPIGFGFPFTTTTGSVASTLLLLMHDNLLYRILIIFRFVQCACGKRQGIANLHMIPTVSMHTARGPIHYLHTLHSVLNNIIKSNDTRFQPEQIANFHMIPTASMHTARAPSIPLALHAVYGVHMPLSTINYQGWSKHRAHGRIQWICRPCQCQGSPPTPPLSWFDPRALGQM